MIILISTELVVKQGDPKYIPSDYYKKCVINLNVLCQVILHATHTLLHSHTLYGNCFAYRCSNAATVSYISLTSENTILSYTLK